MAIETDRKSRQLGIPGMVLGICICLTVAGIAWIAGRDKADVSGERIRTMASFGTVNQRIDELASRLALAEGRIARIDARTTPKPQPIGSAAP